MNNADRHGRARRADGDRRRRPTDGFRARDRVRFARLAEEALAALPPRLRNELNGALLTLQDVPPDDGDETQAPLATLQLSQPRQLTMYRRAIELRAASRGELADVLRDAAAQAVGRALGWPESDWNWEEG